PMAVQLCALPTDPVTNPRIRWKPVHHSPGRNRATCHLDDGVSKYRTVPSYLTDALGDLVAGAGGLYTSDAVQRFSFELEPQELRWVLRREGALAEVTIYSFPDSTASYALPDTAGTIRWASKPARSVFAHAVVEAAQAVLVQHGEEGYREKWIEHPFPTAALQDLLRLHLSEDDCELVHS
ncbi:hypothetical protein, partial [Streptacidiphilus jeojiense]